MERHFNVLRIALIIVSLFLLKLEAQTWEWAYSLHNVNAIRTVITNQNRVIVAGTFTGSCEVKNVVVNGSENVDNILLAGFSSEGNLLWTNTISTSELHDFFLLVENDHVVLGGTLIQSMSGLLHDSTPTPNIFFAKISSNGEVMSYKKDGGTGNAILNGLELAADGSLIASGVYKNTTNFSGIIIQGGNERSGFLLKYDANWNISFAKQLVLTNNYFSSFGKLTTDPSGRIYVSACFRDTIHIINDTTIIMKHNDYEFATQVWKFNHDGKLISVDILGIWGVSGRNLKYFDTHSFDLFSFQSNHVGPGLIISRYDNQAKETWEVEFPGYYSSGAPNPPPPFLMNSCALSCSDSKLWYSAMYTGSYDIGGDYHINNSGMYLAKMDHDGNYENVISAEFDIEPMHLSNISEQGIVLSGYYTKNAVLGQCLLDTSSVRCAFIAKLQDIHTGTNEENIESIFVSVYPNPSSGVFKLGTNKIKKTDCEIYNSYGSLIFSENSFEPETHVLDLGSRPRGIYFLRVKSGNLTTVKKLYVE